MGLRLQRSASKYEQQGTHKLNKPLCRACRSSCWVGAQPRHLLETYASKHSHWLTQLLPQLLGAQPIQQHQQQQVETANAAAAAAGAPDANSSASRSPLLDYIIA